MTGKLVPITHVAIIQDGVTYSLPKPNRHHHVIRDIIYKRPELRYVDGQQGFLDEDGAFLSRAAAKIVAVECCQLLPRASSLDILFSEDVW
jgi:hypothetical protein